MKKELEEAINRIAENTHFSEDAVIDDLTEWLCANGHQGAKFRAQVDRYKQYRQNVLSEMRRPVE